MLSSEDQTAGSFSVVRRGYDMAEVETSIQGIERGWEDKLESAHRRIEELEATIAENKTREEAIHLTLVAVTKTKEELLASAQHKADETIAAASAQAEKTLSEAQYEAFRLVNEAKESSDSAIREAHEEAEQRLNRAKVEAEVILERAREEAHSLTDGVREESERLLAARARELEEMNHRFDTENAETLQRLARLNALATDLEARFQAMARGSIGEITELAGMIRAEVAAEPAIAAPVVRHTPRTPTTTTNTTAEVVTDRHATTAAHTEETPGAAAEDEGEPARGSFYSRRSAKLPRIGIDGTNGVLAAVSAMRSGMIEDSHRSDYEDDDPEPSKMAARTA